MDERTGSTIDPSGPFELLEGHEQQAVGAGVQAEGFGSEDTSDQDVVRVAGHRVEQPRETHARTEADRGNASASPRNLPGRHRTAVHTTTRATTVCVTCSTTKDQ